MKKNYTSIKFVVLGFVAVFISFFLGVVALHAQTNSSSISATEVLPTQVGTNIGTGTADIRVTIANVIRVALGLLGVAALIIVLYGGFVWMTAGGNEEKVAMAKKILRNGVIGLIIILSAYAIVSFIITKLIGNTTGSGGTGTGGGGGGNGNPFFTDSFYVTNLPPSMQLCVRNAVLAITFNQEVDMTSVAGNIAVQDKDSGNADVAGSWAYGPNKRIILFTPQGSCAPADTGNDCFKSKNQYTLKFTHPDKVVTVSADPVANPPLALDCRLKAGCGPVDFVSGETVNRDAPVVSIDAPEPNSAFGVGDTVPVTVSYTSGSGMQNITVFVKNTSGAQVQIGSNSPASCKTSGSVTVQWPTSGWQSGTYAVSAVGTNFAGLSDTKEENILLRPSHCVNGVLETNLGEVELVPPECGGECGVCGGGSCTTNADCASGVCQNGVCTAALTIRDFSPRSGAAGTFVSIVGSQFGSTPGHVYFTDGASLPAGTNLLPNPSFETNATGWAVYTNGTIERSTEASYVGKYSLKLTSAVTNNPLGFYFPRAYFTATNLTPGKTYTASVWLKRATGAPAPGFVVKTMLTTGGESRQNSVTGVDIDDWQRLQYTYTLQANENGLSIQPGIYFGAGLSPGGQAVYIDAVQLEEGANPSAYIDGSLGPGYSWSGTANASVSARAAGTKNLREAQLAPCGQDGSSSWSNNQIIVQSPPNLNIAGVGIQVVGSSGATDATTNHANLPLFTPNTIQHPGICAVSPAAAVAGSLVAVQGSNFGSIKSTNDSVVLSGVKAPVVSKNGNAAWQDTNITASVPGLAPGDAALKVVNNGVDSNSVKFTVDNGVTIGSPLIESVSPNTGAAEDYITIIGKNFGTNKGQVWFKKQPTDVALNGSLDFPAQCENFIWQDNKIIVKAPTSISNGVLKTIFARTANVVAPSESVMTCTTNNVEDNNASKGLVGTINSTLNAGCTVQANILSVGTYDMYARVHSNANGAAFISGTLYGAHGSADLAGDNQSINSSFREEYVGRVVLDSATVSSGMTTIRMRNTVGSNSYFVDYIKFVPVLASGSSNTYVVQVVNDKGGASAFDPNYYFIPTADAPKPGICALSPVSGPVPLPNGAAVKIVGEHLLDGNAAASPVQALFWSLAATSRTATNGRSIATLQSSGSAAGVDTLLVSPIAGAASGPVSVYRSSDGVISNSLDFAVSDCTAEGATCGVGAHCCAAGIEKGVCEPEGTLCKGEKSSTSFIWKFSTKDIPPTPHVVESCSDSDGTLPSPSPSTFWNTVDNTDANKVCRQALATVEFDAALSQATVNAGSVLVQKCASYAPDTGCASPTAVSLSPSSFTLKDAASTNETVHQYLSLQPAALWEDNTYYQVILSQNITSVGSADSPAVPLASDKPCGGNSAYCFTFKTGAQDCALKSVIVTPYKYWTNVLESPMRQPPHNSNTSNPVVYSGNGLSDQHCVMMDMSDWGWGWTSENTNYAAINGSSVNQTAKVNALSNTVGINIPGDSVGIRAAATKNSVTKQATSPLTIDLSNPQVVQYWPQCQEACTNAEVGVQFNMGMSAKNLTNPSTVRLLKCRDENCALTDDVTYLASVQLDVAPPYATIKIANSGNATTIHRGQNLVRNGFADSKTNANFTDQAYSSETHGGAGSFTYSKPAFYSFTNDVIPVDPTKTYYVEGWAKSGDNDGSNYNPINRQHMGVAPVDVDGNLIDAIHTLKVGGSANTKLTADLNPGDTVMHLADVTGWQNGEPNYQRQMMWYGYKDSKGHVYPDYEYTRNTTFDFYANGVWTYRTLGTWAVGGINAATKTITLTSKWPGPLVKAGTAVSNASAGAVYRYLPGSGQNITRNWTKYSGTIGGYDKWMDGTNYYTTFPYGTTGVKIMFINNYGMVGTDAPNTIHWSDVQFYDTSAYSAASSNALEPNSLYKVLVSNANTNPLSAVNNLWSRAQSTDANSFGKPYNQQFTWKFKTKDIACQVDHVEVNPLNYEAQTVVDRSVYAATPFSSPDTCSAGGQKLNPYSVDWSWQTSDAQVAKLNTFVTKGYSPYCTNACVRSGSSVASSDDTNLAICGNGKVEAGEDCDSPSATGNCGLDCRKITGRNGGSSKDADPKNTSQSVCGNGLIGTGEDCDIGITASLSNSQSAMNCSDTCQHSGTHLSSLWCYNHRTDRGGFSVADYQAACAGAISICGDGLAEPEKDPGCDLGNGKHAAWCDERCLVMKDSAANTAPICNPDTEEGCASGAYHLGSSLAYSQPSVCGDGTVGIGEDAICEQQDALVITNSQNLLNPWALAIGVGQAQPTGDPLAQRTTITATTQAPAGAKSADATFTIKCGYLNDSDCSSINPAFGLANNSCCYARSALQSTIPTNGATNICRNTVLEANFDGTIDPATLPGNYLIAFDNGAVACSAASAQVGICALTKDNCTTNADCTTAGDKCNLLGTGSSLFFQDSFGGSTANSVSGPTGIRSTRNTSIQSVWTSSRPDQPLLVATAPSGVNFLGTDSSWGFVNLSNVTTDPAEHTNPILTLNNLPDHDSVTVVADVYIINSWDGSFSSTNPNESWGPDVWQMKADGQVVYKTSFLNIDSPDARFVQAYPDEITEGNTLQHPARTGSVTVDQLGIKTQWLDDTTYRVSKTFTHSGGKLTIDFQGLQNQAAADESWGLGNVRIYLSGGNSATTQVHLNGSNNNWCVGAVTGNAVVTYPTTSTSQVLVTLNSALAPNRRYAVIVSSSVRDVRGVGIGGGVNWQFTTGQDICEVSGVNITPASKYFSKPNASADLLATVVTGKGTNTQSIQPIPGIYDWNYYWRPTNSPFVGIPDVATTNNTVTAKNQNGEVDARVFVRLQSNKLSDKTGVVANGSSHLVVNLCENPWPTQSVGTTAPIYCTKNSDCSGVPSQTCEFALAQCIGTGSAAVQTFPYQDAASNHNGFDLVSNVFNGSSVPPAVNASGVPSPGDGYFNFSTYYCADAGSFGTGDDYPYLRPVVQTSASALTPTPPGICEKTGTKCTVDTDCNNDGSLVCINNTPFKRFIFTNDKNSDAIGIQILPNVKHLTPTDWYNAAKASGGAGFSGALQQVQVSGYDAVSDGNNIYVAALNVANNKLYDVIYEFSINANADKATRHVFEELIRNVRFNTNLNYNDGYCGSSISTPYFTTKCSSDLDCSNGQVCSNQVAELQRNFARLRNLQQIDSLLASYYSAHNNMYPSLGSGTYLAGQTVSTWPSWNTLGNALGYGMPIDPVNQLSKSGTCKLTPGQYCVVDTDCPAVNGSTDSCVIHDSATGWSAADRRFSFACPIASYAYRYIVGDKAKSFTFLNKFENPGFSPTNLSDFIKGFGFTNVSYFVGLSSDWTSLGNINGICTRQNEISSLNQGTCGDGVVNASLGEACDPPGSKTFTNPGSCATGGATMQTCQSNCSWSAPSPAQCADITSFKCGNGKIDPGEACDDGTLNGTYNHCASDCKTTHTAAAGYCGDSVLQSKYEVCDTGLAAKNPGSSVLGDGSVYNASKSKSCNWNCQNVGSYCGDGIVNGNEECDGDQVCSFNGQPGIKKCTASCKWQTVADVSSPVGWWPLGDDDNVFAEKIPITADEGSSFNPPLSVPGGGENGQATSHFNGSSNYVNALLITPITANLTVEAWINPENNTVMAQRVLEKGGYNANVDNISNGGFGFEFNRSAQETQKGQVIRFIVWRDPALGSASGLPVWLAADSGVNLPLNKWSHIVGTYEWDATNHVNVVKIYVNGQLVGQNTLLSQTRYMGSAQSDDLIIGHNSASPQEANYFTGSVDNVKIYNKTLTADQVKNEFSNTTPCVPNAVAGITTSDAESCGNGVVEANEACDSGTLNGAQCTPGYGAACSYCSSDCKNVVNIQPQMYCGDNKLQSQYEKCEVVDNVLVDAAGAPVTACRQDKNTKVNLSTAAINVNPATLLTYKKGVKSCNSSCSSVVDNCIECGLDQKNGKLISGSIINVLDSSGNASVSSLNLYYATSSELANAGSNVPSYQVAHAQITPPASASQAPTFVLQAAPVPSDPAKVQNARLVTNAACFNVAAATEEQYLVVLNDELNNPFALPGTVISQSYNLILSPRIPPTRPNDLRIVVRWQGTSSLVGGFVLVPGNASYYEGGKDIVGSNYAQTASTNGVWYHGVKGSSPVAEESFTLNTASVPPTSYYQFYVRTYNRSSIANVGVSGGVQVDVYGPENNSNTFGKPIRSFFLIQAAASENAGAQYWYVFDVVSDGTNNHIQTAHSLDSNSGQIIQYENGRVASDPVKF